MKISGLESTTSQARDILLVQTVLGGCFGVCRGRKSPSAAIETRLQLRKPKAVSVWVPLSCYHAKPGFLIELIFSSETCETNLFCFAKPYAESMFPTKNIK